MPEFTLPQSAAEWAAVETNETDAALLNSAELHLAYTPKSEFDKHLALAAASRLLERERCVERLAQEIVRRGDTLQPGHQPTNAEAAAEARRILEDAK